MNNLALSLLQSPPKKSRFLKRRHIIQALHIYQNRLVDRNPASICINRSFHRIVALVFNTLLSFSLFSLTTSTDRRIWVRQRLWGQELPVVRTCGERERHAVCPVTLLNGRPPPSVTSREAWVHISALSPTSVCLPASCWIAEFPPLQRDDSRALLTGLLH